MGRAPCCDKANVKRGPWSPEEDATLKSYIEKFGTGGNWIALPQKIGLKRCGKSCRLRWLNYLRPNIRHGGFSEEEDNIICSLYRSIGSRWSIIASRLPGRTDNDIKNHWNTKLKKNILSKQRQDQHDSAWRAAILMKQEMIKSENNEYFMVNNNQYLSQDQGWPMLPTAHISHQNQHYSYPYLDYQPDHHQLHTPIIGSSNAQYPSEFPVAQEQLYDSFISMISSPIPENLITSSNYLSNNEEGLANFDGFCGLARTDFDKFISGSKQGMENELERFCAIDFSKYSCSSGTSSRESSTTWADTNSLGNTPLVPDCEIFQQTLSYNFAIDDPLIRFQ